MKSKKTLDRANDQTSVRDKEEHISYAMLRRANTWSENSLASSDEDESFNFSWQSMRQIVPYVKRYRGMVLLSIGLMLVYTVLNLANPFLIGLAIDSFIRKQDLPGLAGISVVLLLVNVGMWQAQYWQIWTMSWAGQQILYRLSSD